MATIRDVANRAQVSTATVSAVVNDSAYVSPELRTRVLAAINDLNYAPSQAARSLKRGRSQLIALVVADLANPFFARLVWAAEAAVAAWGYSLVLFNSDEKPENERRILARIRALSCDGIILVPVDVVTAQPQRDSEGEQIPTVLFGRTVEGQKTDTITIDNISAARQVTNYLMDLGHVRIGTITGPLHLTTGRGRLDGMLEAMRARGLEPAPNHVRAGEFREDTAYSVARELLTQAEPPTALYVANGVMALGVMRALADLGLKCPDDISIASTDTIPGIGGLRPRLTRTEHPVIDMTNEALRLLVDRINRGTSVDARNVVFQPSLVVGESCAPLRNLGK
ncbi:LacI family transcriptional regulator [Neorhizobium sp. P12A]|uniref:LacI family DNA-binding transcriptional regulator n=1 Tax=Rhizobium/Agrobacterium group TaxID=227290 RepID=UPI00104BA0E2|nr:MULTISPECIES: LacI family DNA-binding transcriptional regulator [Rhizobium/Agrobacterium group]KAA0697974.1 LacI family transcriptional regulator [Neorhizobium sp. P12A]TCR87788.1 LacI family transcriptional regulator [Rhizobium sp. BK376]